MYTRTLTTLAATLTTAGLASAAIGMHVTHTPHPVVGGVVLILAAVPPAAATRTRARRQARNEGYRLGLEHVARGLLQPPTAGRYARGQNDTERNPE